MKKNKPRRRSAKELKLLIDEHIRIDATPPDELLKEYEQAKKREMREKRAVSEFHLW